jgi:hypothetical protein
VTPASFRVRGKQSQKVTISITPRTDTPLNKYQFGQASWWLTWGGGVLGAEGHNVW